MVYLVKKMIPGEDLSLKRGTTFIDDRMLNTPYAAIDQVKKEIIAVGEISRDRVKVCSQTSWACPVEREDGIEF